MLIFYLGVDLIPYAFWHVYDFYWKDRDRSQGYKFSPVLRREIAWNLRLSYKFLDSIEVFRIS